MAPALLREKSKLWKPCFYPSPFRPRLPRALRPRKPPRVWGISPKSWRSSISKKGIPFRRTPKCPREPQRFPRWPILSWPPSGSPMEWLSLRRNRPPIQVLPLRLRRKTFLPLPRSSYLPFSYSPKLHPGMRRWQERPLLMGGKQPHFRMKRFPHLLPRIEGEEP